MCKEINYTNGHIQLVKGPVNTALYDLRKGNVYSVNPLMADIINDMVDKSCRSTTIKRDTLDVLRGYLSRHPALAGISDISSKNGFLKPVGQAIPSTSEPIALNYVWLEITNSCNLTCTHCYAEADNNNPYHNPPRSKERRSISIDQWKKIIAECSRLGAREIQFTGGEPTMHPGLIGLIEHARSCLYTDIEVFTNATGLEESLLRQWSALGVKAALSFYSSDAGTHDRITGLSGTFSLTVQGIRDILAYNIPMRVAIVIMRDNMSHLADTVELLKGLGVKSEEIEWDYVRPTGRGEAVAINAGKGAGTKITPFKPSSLGEGNGACDKEFAMGTCWKGKIAISSVGNVYPCIFARQISAGNYPESSIEEIINGQTLQRLWQITMDKVKVCRDCELRYGCFDCRALAQTITGDLFSKNPRCDYNPYTGHMERNGGLKMKERPKKRNDIVNGDVGDEMVIYDSKNDNVHHLDLLASVIWDLCDGSHTVKDIAEEIIGVLKADPVQVERDVTRTIDEFQEKGLLEEVSKRA